LCLVASPVYVFARGGLAYLGWLGILAMLLGLGETCRIYFFPFSSCSLDFEGKQEL
jgi:hypothetical protein